MRTRLSFVIVVAITGAAACGKSDQEKFADSYCGEIVKCCAKAGVSGNGQFCHLAMSGGGYNAKAGDSCLAEMKQQVAAGSFCDNLDGPSACDSVFPTASGNNKPGEVCQFDSDCATSTAGPVSCASIYTGTNPVYKCQVQMPGKAGDTPCVGTRQGTLVSYYTDPNATDVLAQGYVCDTADGVRCKAGTCVALAQVGEACTYTSDCIAAAFCDYSKDQCVARFAAGGACTGNDSAECVDGYYCPTTGTKQCTAQLGTGAQCSDDAMCQSDMCSTTCQPGFIDTMGLAALCAG